jgi:hypothetical protein
MRENHSGTSSVGGSKNLSFDEQVALVTGALRLFLAEDDQVGELRALGVQRGRERPHTESGFFDGAHVEEMARAALTVTPVARGVYVTINPLRPDILARRANRIDYAGDAELASDKDVIRRRWLFIDADPVRDSKVSATASEKAAAHEVALRVRDYLGSLGWPAPVLADSGNGCHVLYRVDLPTEDGGLLKSVLAALARRFDTDAVKIDRAVYNPARLCKVPGTLARKGDSIEKRPHRRSKILELPQ